MDVSKILGHQFKDVNFNYTERDTALYALSVGAANDNPTNPEELQYVYNNIAGNNFKVLPTFAVLFPGDIIQQFMSLESLKFDPKLLLHGEQTLELFRPIPTSAEVRNVSRISDIQDKGKAALIEVETDSFIASTNEIICTNRSVCFLRGAGGFEKSRPSNPPPSSPKPIKAQKRSVIPIPPKNVAPNFSVRFKTDPSQALLYRLNGDLNPLHSDPEFAAQAGFERPILHGLCTLGFSTRAVISRCCHGVPENLQSLHVRFLLHVFPGETLKTNIWAEPDGRIIFECEAVERNATVLRGVAKVQRQLAKL